VVDDDLLMAPRDSYSEFLDGFWKIITLGRRYERWVMSDPVRKEAHWKGTTKIEAGEVQTVNERIDLSVIRRCQIHQDYRPANLQEWAARKKLNLEAVIKEPEKYSQYWSPVTEFGVENE
jgi:hypothetical protein